MYEACHAWAIAPIIPPRKRARARKGAAFAHRNEAVKACRRLGRQIWKDWSGYHRRSLVETKMGCFKRLGEKVSARTFERQVVELNIRAAILNRSCSNQQQLAICQNAGFAYFQRSFGAGCHPTTNNQKAVQRTAFLNS